MSQGENVKVVDHGSITLPDAQIVSCGDLSCEFLVNPIPRPKQPEIKINIQPKEREVVLVSNFKPNSTNIMRHAQKVLRERGINVREEIYEKANPSMPLKAAELDAISKNGGLILCGVSD